MGERSAERIEAAVDRIAAALFALAAGYVAYLWGGAFEIPALVAAVSVSLVAYGAAVLLLRKVPARQPGFAIANFEHSALPEFEPQLEELLLTQWTELLLTDADRVGPPPVNQADVLVLDDILAEIGPGARVVRLFDPGSMPTPGQLKSRIDSHLHRQDAAAFPDASQALHEALAELRRSLG